LRRAYYRAKGNTGELLHDLGVTAMQAAAVIALRRFGPISQAELGRAIGMAPANVHGLVARLKKLELVRVQPHPTDARQVRVGLSRAGEKLAGQLAELSMRSAEKTLAMLEPLEKEAFIALLGRVALD